jgi:nucleoside-diphosphate kinase
MPIYGKPGTAHERTFLMVKPDGVARGVVHDIIGRWEKRGFTLVRCGRWCPARARATRACHALF